MANQQLNKELLYSLRSKHYNTTSPRYDELTNLISSDDRAGLAEFGARNFIGKALDEFRAVVASSPTPKHE